MTLLQKIMPHRGLSTEAKATEKAEKQTARANDSIAIELRCLDEAIRSQDTKRIEKDTVLLKERIEKSDDVNVPSSKEGMYWNPFRMAIGSSVPAFALEWLLKAGGDPNAKVYEKSLLAYTSWSGGTAERLEKVTLLIRYGATVGEEELKAAVENNNVDIFKLLVFALKDLDDTGAFESMSEVAKNLVAVAPNPTMAYHVMKELNLNEATFVIKDDGKEIDQITLSRELIL